MQRPRLRARRRYAELKDRLQAAIAAVEETNRVVGLSKLVEHVQASGPKTAAVMDDCRRHIDQQDANAFPFVVWGLAEPLPTA